VHAWAAEAFGAAPREVYGLTECAFLLVNAEARPGVTGQVAPPHTVGIVRSDGSPCRKDEVGEVTVRRGSPTMMLGYLRDGRLDLPLDAHGWFHTGDLAKRDHAWRVTVLGRLDDAVKVSGYRVSPREVEQELLRHPAVDECAVVGMPDAERGAALHAFVKPAPGAEPGEALARELAAWVKERLAAHQAPRSVEFVGELPRTTSGKVLRRALKQV
jgi:acetyl-CoA synthetase